MQKLTLDQIKNIKTARNIFEQVLDATDCTLDDYELFEVRETMQAIINWLEDGQDAECFEHGVLELDNELVCGEVNIVADTNIQEILEDYFKNYCDEYVLGCARSGFLSEVTGIPTELLDHMRNDGCYTAMGKYIVGNDEMITKYAEGFNDSDGRKWVFGGYDDNEYETTTENTTYYIHTRNK